jgi:hypothetical protein
MSFLKKLFGGGSKPTHVTPQASSSPPKAAPIPASQAPSVREQDTNAMDKGGEQTNRSLGTILDSAVAQGIPSEWKQLEGHNGNRRFTLRVPPTWLEGTSPEDLEHIILKPPSSHVVDAAGKPMVSPCVTVVSARGANVENEALLDRWLATRGQQFQGYVLRESVKTKLSGLRSLAIRHDFTLGGQTWNCLMVVRVDDNQLWYADASGLEADFSSHQADIVRILASMIVDAEPQKGNTPALRELKGILDRFGRDGGDLASQLMAVGYKFEQAGPTSALGRRGDDEIVIDIRHGGLRSLSYKSRTTGTSEFLIESGQKTY